MELEERKGRGITMGRTNNWNGKGTRWRRQGNKSTKGTQRKEMEAWDEDTKGNVFSNIPNQRTR
jgi:hypothetical protein